MKLNDTQLSQVDAQIKRLVKTDSYYGKKYRELGITDVTSQEAFEELPFSSKDDLRNAYPLGIQAVPFIFRNNRKAGYHTLYSKGCR